MAIEDTSEPVQGMSGKPSRTKVLKDLKSDMRAADSLRLEMVANIETWRDEYHGMPYGNEQTGKSEIVSKDIKRQDGWQHSSIKAPFTDNTDIIKCRPVTFEDRAAAEQNQLVLNHQFVRQFPRYNFMTDAIKLYYSEGTVIVKCFWEYEDEVIEEERPIWGLSLTGEPMEIGMTTVKIRKVKKNQPGAKACRIEDIYIDPTCEGELAKAQFVIHRYESDMSTLRKAKKYKNLKKVAAMVGGRDYHEAEDYDPEDETEFRFSDNPRKKLVVYEYWGNYDIDGDGIAEPIVCTWVEDTIIQLESNPYPDEEIPFLLVKNNSIPFKIYGEAAAELIGDNQKINTAIKRGIIDNMANSNNAQKGIRVGALDPINKKRFLNGKNFEFNGSPADFYEGSYNQIPQSVFAVMEQNNNETESIQGVKAFSGGISGSSLGSTAKAAGGVLDAVSVRRIDIVQNIAENLIKPLMRKWMAYNSEFLAEEEIIRITNSDFVPVKRDDLKGQVDIEIEVSTVEEDSLKAERLSFLFQTLGQQMDQGMRNMLMSEIFLLQKMPDIAKAVREYEPPPDPYVEKLKELELMEKQANITERMSRAEENKVDMLNKQTQAELNQAKTREISSGTDLKDLDFTRKADGTEFQEQMALKNSDQAARMAEKIADVRGKIAIEQSKPKPVSSQ